MIQALVQGVGVATFAVAVGFFRTTNYKKEFTLFGLTGITLIFLGRLIPV